ncbi:MAG TPA: 5,10-methylenetetrahydrofolate reductase [Candidatus Altiarchaeales archaeon]|nr:5,10-methylenetetrahydrofolate reductase [Candidatus Altiarchaeales archaeon]
MSKLSKNFGKEFIVTGEVAPPRGPDLKEFMHEVEEFKKLMNRLYGVNVVDIPGARLLMSSLAASILLKQNGIDPIYQLVCRDRNQLALEADLIGAAAFGIENVLALTGDHPSCRSSDHPKAKGVFDLDSATLIKTMKLMNQGKDLVGVDLNKPTNFFIGAALAPGATPIEGEIHKTKRKLDAGTDFFQTQAVFESSMMWDFLDKYESLMKEDIADKILMGLVPLYSYGMVQFLRTMPGIVISEETGKRIKEADDPVEEGINIASELIDMAREMNLAGVHIMPSGKIEALMRLLESI